MPTQAAGTETQRTDELDGGGLAVQATASAQAPGGGGRARGSEIGGSRAAEVAANAAIWLLSAAIICLVTFFAGGGLSLTPTTEVEIALTLGAGLAIAAAILLAAPGRRIAGGWPAALMLALTALTAISASWSVAPNASWQEAAQMLAYSSVFIAAATLARAAPRRWEGLLGGIALAAVIVCGYALATKVFPAQLDPGDPYARLRAPYDYWNATGLAAAMGMLACLWLGARRGGHALVRALAYPATGLLMVTLMLAYSRGSLAVAAIGVAVWMAIVPLRLRGASLLITAGAGATGVVAFAFANSSLSSEGVALAARVSAGHQLGVLLLAMLVLLALAGVTIGFATGRRAPSPRLRRRAGATLLAAIAIAVLAGIGGLAASHRGFTGTISHTFSSVTNPNAPVPANTPGRLTAVSSVRARYWKEAIEVFEAHPALGAGAGGYATASLRYRPAGLEARHAHGFAVQTLADLGAVGIAIALALLIAWALAAGAATHPFNRRWSRWRWRSIALPYTPERIGMLSMLCIAITFGVHSLEDWTWYVPGTAIVALLCAGWLAGRGAIEAPIGTRRGRWRHIVPSRLTRPRMAAAAAAVAAALVAAWAQWQPARSAEGAQEALALASSAPPTALADAKRAAGEDPLSAEALFTLAIVQQQIGRRGQARATLQRAVKRQPANPETWLTLGEYDLPGHPKAALRELRAALYLNPQSVHIQNEYVLALRAAGSAESGDGAAGGGKAGGGKADGGESGGGKAGGGKADGGESGGGKAGGGKAGGAAVRTAHASH